MASSCGTSSGSSSLFHNSGSEEDIQQIMDTRKRKRMISNRESARRSRMRKQQHMDDLGSQVNQLRNDNNLILTNINVTTQLYLNIEAENSILRAQMSELNHRLQSLNDIINCINATNYTTLLETEDHNDIADQNLSISTDDFLNPWNLLYVNQTILASPNLLMY